MIKLTEREEIILKIIVDEYTYTSEPVGSRLVSKSEIVNLSPASIRNVMSDLEEQGIICQPHTSAGRIPTDQGYRYYIDKIVEFNTADSKLFEDMRSSIEHSSINGLFNEVSKKLGNITHSVGFVLSPKLNTMHLKHIEFLRLGNDNVIGIIVTQTGMVHNILLNIDPLIKDNELIRVSNYLNDRFSKKTLQEIKDHIASEVKNDKSHMDSMIANMISVGKDLFSKTDFGEDLILQGTNNMVEMPEFRDLVKLKEMLSVFEEKSLMYGVLDKCINQTGINIFVGSEIGTEQTNDFGLVLKPYHRGGKTIGTLGVIGPKRMDYSKVVSIVDCTAEIISNVLNSIGGDK